MAMLAGTSKPMGRRGYPVSYPVLPCAISQGVGYALLCNIGLPLPRGGYLLQREHSPENIGPKNRLRIFIRISETNQNAQVIGSKKEISQNPTRTSQYPFHAWPKRPKTCSDSSRFPVLAKEIFMTYFSDLFVIGLAHRPCRCGLSGAPPVGFVTPVDVLVNHIVDGLASSLPYPCR